MFFPKGTLCFPANTLQIFFVMNALFTFLPHFLKSFVSSLLEVCLRLGSEGEAVYLISLTVSVRDLRKVNRRKMGE